METWSKRISAITFGNGRKLISPHRNASSNTLFIISLERICSHLWGFSKLKRTHRGWETSKRRNVFLRRPAELFLCNATVHKQKRTPQHRHILQPPFCANVSALRTFPSPSRWEWTGTACSHDPSLCFHIDIKPSIRGLLSPSWQRLGFRLWHTFNN